MVDQFLVLGSNKASLPGGVEREQFVPRSQPGIATQTRSVPSNAVPQGSLPGTLYSVTLLTPPVCGGLAALTGSGFVNAPRVLATIMTHATLITRILLLWRFIQLHLL